MKLFVQDYGRYGEIIVLADDEASARSMMSGTYNYNANLPVEELPMVPGIVWRSLGDR